MGKKLNEWEDLANRTKANPNKSPRWYFDTGEIRVYVSVHPYALGRWCVECFIGPRPTCILDFTIDASDEEVRDQALKAVRQRLTLIKDSIKTA